MDFYVVIVSVSITVGRVRVGTTWVEMKPINVGPCSSSICTITTPFIYIEVGIEEGENCCQDSFEYTLSPCINILNQLVTQGPWRKGKMLTLDL